MKQRIARWTSVLLIAALLAGMLCMPGLADEGSVLTVGNTRAELVYLLWWMQNCPEPTITENPFTDISESDDYYKAVLWACEKHILRLFDQPIYSDATLFMPTELVRRGEAINCLYQAYGHPRPDSWKRPFVDVNPGDSCDQAILWAVKQDWITLSQWSGGNSNQLPEFRPKRHVEKLTATRAASGVTFALVAETEDRPDSCGMDGDNLTWSFDEQTGTLTITGSGEMADFQINSPRPWEALKEKITAIHFPEGMTSIGQNAFRDCTQLQTLTIPDSVVLIGQSAFFLCKELRELTISDSVETIDSCAFSGCFSLQRIHFGKNLRRIGSGAFFGCEALQELDLPQQLEIIEKFAFDNCTSLTRVSLPDGLQQIGERAFYNCPSLKSVTIPAGVEKIAPYSLGFWHDDENALAGSDPLKGFVIYGEKGSAAEDYARSNYILFAVPGGQPENLSKHGFSDVKQDSWFYPAVEWATSQLPPITNGVDETHFAPNQTCSRAEIVMFLWNASEKEGMPYDAYEKLRFRFSDVHAANLVQAGDWFYKAVFWAAYKGVTSGVDETHFCPEQNCTRAEVVMFLWNAAGKPDVGGRCPRRPANSRQRLRRRAVVAPAPTK